MSARPEVLARALAAIDAANAEDPTRVGDRPLAAWQGERASEWLARLAPDAGEALQLAVRAHHLRRWAIPRSDRPPGRSGYLRWRRDLKAVHRDAVAEVLEPVGVATEVVARAQDLVQKKGLGTDPETQVFEDVVCLVFLETQFEELIDKVADDDKMVDVLAKTLPKMSPAAHELAAEAARHPRGRELLARAVSQVQEAG